MCLIRVFLGLLLPVFAGAQLVAPNAIPNGAIPVVFVNGYQLGCTGDHSFQSNFDNADTVLQASGLVTVYFDNCTIPGNPPIETLGAGFGKFLASLTYVNGMPVPVVDVVAHSMGGLIVRAYLSGMQTVIQGMPTTFAPPINTGIRNAIFLGTPNFGTYAANDLGDDAQTHEMALGSQFLYDLNTWNQGTDDLRGVNALAVAGNGGTGEESNLAGSNLSNFDDGLIELTSSSIGFAITGRTRVVPDCHTNDPLLVDFGLCGASTPALNQIDSTSNVVGQIITSFLTGTSTWTTLGQAIEQNGDGQTVAGLLVGAEDMNGNPVTITGVTFGANSPLSVSSGVAYKEAVQANAKATLSVNVTGSAAIDPTITTPAGTTLAVIAKPGPSITGIVPAGIAQYPRDVAPGAYVTVYGSNLANNTVTSPQPYPTQLADAQVIVNGTAAQVQYVSATQINFVYPQQGLAATTLGLVPITVKNSSGSQTLNVFVVPAVPSIFTTTGVANGPAAAENAVTFAVINANNPLHAGDYVALYLTGIGASGLTTTVTVGGQNCAGTYFFAGPNSVYEALDQVDCQIPPGVTGSAVPVVITTNGYASNTATLNIQ